MKRLYWRLDVRLWEEILYETLDFWRKSSNETLVLKT